MLPDWQNIEDRLFDHSVRVIEQFAGKHPDEVVSFFAYDADPVYGYFHLCLDTSENGLKVAQRQEHEVRDQRTKYFGYEQARRWSKWSWTYPAVVDYSSNVGDFAYSLYAELVIDELVDLIYDEDYPETAEHEEDYSTSLGRVLMWKVIERLIESGVFERLRLAAPFRLGYQFHDEGLIVMRILNWPEPQL